MKRFLRPPSPALVVAFVAGTPANRSFHLLVSC
jgi:hypothetical protein